MKNLHNLIHNLEENEIENALHKIATDCMDWETSVSNGRWYGDGREMTDAEKTMLLTVTTQIRVAIETQSGAG